MMTTNRKRMKPVSLALLLACIWTMLFPIRASATDTTPPDGVTTAQGLMEAISAAEDGDVILVNDVITFDSCVELGSMEKTVTLLRGAGDVYIDFMYEGGAATSTVTNIIFDGNGMSTTNGMGFVSVNQNMVFDNCQFQNCPRSCAVMITEANISVEFNGCYFNDNHNVWGDGGHISVGNAANINLNDCRMEKGSSANSGGAIGMMFGASCTVTDSIITDNEAADLGGGICVTSSGNMMTVVNSLIYGNKASQGADIAAGLDTELDIRKEIPTLNTSSAENKITFFGWTLDYGIVPNGISFNEYADMVDLVLLKMAFEAPPEDPIIITETVYETVYEPVYITDTKTEVVEKIVEIPVKEKRGSVTLQSGEVILDKDRPVQLQGYDNGDLGLDDPVSRAQLAMLLYRQMKDPVPLSDAPRQFPDVSEDAWYYTAVTTMADAGVIVGSDDGNFHPDDPVTWAQMISILYRFTEWETECHIITSHWAKDALNTAIEQNWIDYNDQFVADAPANRGEVQTFLNTVLTWAKGE